MLRHPYGECNTILHSDETLAALWSELETIQDMDANANDGTLRAWTDEQERQWIERNEPTLATDALVEPEDAWLFRILQPELEASYVGS